MNKRVREVYQIGTAPRPLEPIRADDFFYRASLERALQNTLGNEAFNALPQAKQIAVIVSACKHEWDQSHHIATLIALASPTASPSPPVMRSDFVNSPEMSTSK